MFLKNERSLGVKNGTLATVEAVSEQMMTARLDDGRSVSFDLKDYAHVDHGYAATIHKAQGMTVDRTHVLATPGLDAHGSYVALSRHRDGVELHYGRDDFADRRELADKLGRDRSKDMATDYAGADPAEVLPKRPKPLPSAGASRSASASSRWCASWCPRSCAVPSMSWCRPGMVGTPGKSGMGRTERHQPRRHRSRPKSRSPRSCAGALTGCGCVLPLSNLCHLHHRRAGGSMG
jgi:hypothetical protein